MILAADVLIFVIGACVGSFLNVCIHRMPKDESVVSPGSHCPHCQKPVPWYFNMPLVSYCLLGGKCRFCKSKIAFRYFLVELLTAVTWLGLWKYYGPSPWSAAGIVLFSILIAVTMTDFETGLIPDQLSFTGMILGLSLSTISPALHHESIWYYGLLKSFVGLLAGGLILIVVGTVGNWIYKKESMGGGDVKLLAMIGAFTGWPGALTVFAVSPVLSLPFALYMRLVKKEETIAFGPFIAMAGAVYFIFGEAFLNWYFYQRY